MSLLLLFVGSALFLWGAYADPLIGHTYSLFLPAAGVLIGCTVNLLNWVTEWRSGGAIETRFLVALRGARRDSVGGSRVAGRAILLASAVLIFAIIYVSADVKDSFPFSLLGGMLSSISAACAVLDVWSSESIVALGEAMRADVARESDIETGDRH